MHFQNICVYVQSQEVWSTDNNKVQEFMFSYLKDPLREVEQPYFHQDEVCTRPLTTSPIFTRCGFLFLQSRGKIQTHICE